MHSDGSFDDKGMNSFNHYAYGAIGSWMYQKLCGIQIIEPGYKKSCIAPMPIKGITEAGASVKTAYGVLACKWSYKDSRFSVEIAVPCNSTAVVRLPGKSEEFTLGSGIYSYEYSMELNFNVPNILIPKWG